MHQRLSPAHCSAAAWPCREDELAEWGNDFRVYFSAVSRVKWDDSTQLLLLLQDFEVARAWNTLHPNTLGGDWFVFSGSVKVYRGKSKPCRVLTRGKCFLVRYSEHFTHDGFSRMLYAKASCTAPVLWVSQEAVCLDHNILPLNG